MSWRLGKPAIGVAAAMLLGLSLAVLPASSAQAASACLDNGPTFSLFTHPSGGSAVLPTDGSVYTTTNRCQDINFAIIAKDSDFSGNVRVCFVRAGYCNSWKPYNSRWDVWKVIASDVRDGTTFRVELNYDNTTFGHYQGRVSS
jgi:hypothetical protein